MSRPLTICHIVLRLDFGGLQNGLVMLVNNMPADRYRHAIICLEHASDFRDRIRRKDVPIYEIHKQPGKGVASYLRVWSLLRQIRPDLVHTRNLPTVDMLAPARLAGVRALVHSEHGVDMAELAAVPPKYRMLRRLSRFVVGRYIAVSKDLANWMTAANGLPPDRISVIPNGVDRALFRPPIDSDSPREERLPAGFATPSSFVVGTIGRLAPVKDQTNLVRAFLLALDQRPSLRQTLRLVILGDGSLRDEMLSLIDAAGARSLVWMPGFCNDTAEYYRTFDLFALPSRREGTSNTILEAMASGLPVAATDVGGNPSLVTPDVTGLLVPAETPSALSEAICRYVDDRALALQHGRAGRAVILQNYSIEAMVKGYEAVYDAVAKGH